MIGYLIGYGREDKPRAGKQKRLAEDDNPCKYSQAVRAQGRRSDHMGSKSGGQHHEDSNYTYREGIASWIRYRKPVE